MDVLVLRVSVVTGWFRDSAVVLDPSIVDNHGPRDERVQRSQFVCHEQHGAATGDERLQGLRESGLAGRIHTGGWLIEDE